MRVLIFSATTFPIVRITQRYIDKFENVFMLSTRYYCRILMKLEFSREVFVKKAKYLIS
jgi:hypothetical protein